MATEETEVRITKAAYDAMEATFALADAIVDSAVTISDLTLICGLAIEEGHGQIQLALSMMRKAVEKSEENVEQPTNGKNGNGHV